MKVEHAVFIHLPIEETFAYMCNLENLADWSGFVISARIISSEEMLIGTTVRCTVRILGRWFETTYEIVECVTDRYLSFKSIIGIAPSLTYYRFEPLEGGGTNVSTEVNIHFTGGYLGFDETMITNLVSRQIANDLQTLKDLLETTASHFSNTESTTRSLQ
ncbi:MAG: SRPBCC family protein [Ktedonobacteraceae bacterium]